MMPKHEAKTWTMNSLLVIYFVLKISLLHCGKWSLSLFTLAIKRSTGISKIVKKLGKHGHALIPTKATGFLLGSVATWQVGWFSSITMSNTNYIEINVSCWKCSPGVLVRTAPGGNVLQRRDIIPSSPCNMPVHYRATLAVQGRVVYLDKTEK